MSQDILSLEKHRLLQSGYSDIEASGVENSNPEPKELVKSEMKVIQVVDHSSEDLLTRSVIDLCGSVQFPYSTAYMHGLGVISCAMNRSFSVELFGEEMPVTLYVLTAQPPSTGKSSINNYFAKPFRIAVKDLNDKNKKIRDRLEARLKELNEAIKQSTNDDELDSLCADYTATEEKVAKVYNYKAVLTNTTPEAMESIAFSQDGLFNIISDEAGAINSSLGLSYGDSGKAINNDMVLQGWDGNYFSSARITRGCNEGEVSGGFSVIAQDETINTIFMQGRKGNGLSERFLLCMEPNLLGSRDVMNYKPVDNRLKVRYSNLINNIVNTDKVVLKIGTEGNNFLKDKKQQLEPHLADLGKYSDSMLRGFVGKMEKHVVKIACVIHAVDNFENGVNNLTIELKSLKRAYDIFAEVTRLYVHAANDVGVSGDEAQLESMRGALQRSLAKGQYVVKVSALLDNVKKSMCWARQHKITSHFRGNIMPRMAKMYWCNYDPIKGVNYIRINPKL